MKNKLFITPKYLLLAGLTIFVLSACGESLESPEVVIDKAKQAIVDISSGTVDVSAEAEGKNGTDDLLFEGGMELTFDKSDAENQKLDLHIMLSGNLQAGEKSLDGDLDVNFVTVDKEYYVKLNKLSSSDESLTSIQPFIDLYIGKWLRIAEDFIPENIRELQGQDEAIMLKKKQLQDLFVETTLFDVVKEYGVENLNGEKVYHYGLQPNIGGFKDYMAKAAIIDGRELTAQEIEEAVKVLSYIKEAELYIDVDDYYVLRSIFLFSGAALSEEADANLEVEIVIDGSDFNKSVSVKAPEGAEDFNPLNLMMGFGGVPTMPDGTEGLEEMEITEEDITETE
jgi:hypothetical protein